LNYKNACLFAAPNAIALKIKPNDKNCISILTYFLFLRKRKQAYEITKLPLFVSPFIFSIYIITFEVILISYILIAYLATKHKERKKLQGESDASAI